MGVLLLAGTLVLVGIGMSLRRKVRRPFWMSGLNLLVSVGVFYLTIMLDLNVHFLDLVRGRPLVVAAYVGTRNSAVLRLRAEGRMDLLSTGWPGAKRFVKGTYQLRGSDLLLRFEKRKGSDSLPYGFEHVDRAVIGGGEIRRAATADGYNPSFRIVHEESGAVARWRDA